MQPPETLTGLVLAPGDPGYDEARLDYNTRFPPATPRYIDFCRSPADVSRAIRFARGYGYPLRARSGRHSYEAYSVVDGGIVIDVSPLNQVQYDHESGLARIGAGAPLLDVYQKLWDENKVTIPAGSCPTVGIAGLTLGGGIGLLSRLFGLTADALTSLEMVDASGAVLTASRQENEGLFWASQGGGGGNFGVVTEFTFRTQPVDSVAIFYLRWPWSELQEVLEAYQLWADPTGLDRRVMPLFKLTSKLASEVALIGEFVGPAAELYDILRPMARTGKPTIVQLKEVSYIDAVDYFAGVKPHEEHFRAQGLAGLGTPEHEMFKNTSAYQYRLFDSAAIRTIIRYLAASTNPATVLQFDGLGGRVADVSPTATAFAHRGARASLQYQAYWEDPRDATRNIRWVEEFRDAMLPYTFGAYVNYIDADIGNWPLAYYGENLPRLLAVKKAYDPDLVFDFPQGLAQLLQSARLPFSGDEGC